MKIIVLINPSNNRFDYNKLEMVLGPVHAPNVLQEFQNFTLKPHVPDKLMFTIAANGTFRLKRGYRLLAQTHQVTVPSEMNLNTSLWRILWHTPAVPPRVILFIWKAIRGAIPVCQILHKRIQDIDEICPLCGTDIESVAHMMFHCSHARATWFQSPLGIRTNCQPITDVYQIFKMIWGTVAQNQIHLTMIISWQIRKSRCSCIFFRY